MATKVVVRHFHEGNDANRVVRKSALYATFAGIIDLDTGLIVEHPSVDKSGFAEDSHMVQAWVFCNPKDVPSRKQGRAIAIGRLQKQFPEECAKADFGVFKNLKVPST